MSKNLSLVKKGDRIKVNVRLFSGWKGYATATRDQYGQTVEFRKDGSEETMCLAMRHEISIVKHSG